MIRPPVRIDRRRGGQTTMAAASATAGGAGGAASSSRGRGGKGPYQQQRPLSAQGARAAGADGGAECQAALAQAQLKLEGVRAQLAGFAEGSMVKEAVARRGVLQVRVCGCGGME